MLRLYWTWIRGRSRGPSTSYLAAGKLKILEGRYRVVTAVRQARTNMKAARQLAWKPFELKLGS